MDDFLAFIADNRIYLIVGMFAVWIIYVLYHTGKLKKPEWFGKPALLEVKPSAEQRVATTEALLQKTQKELERHTLTIAKMKRDQMKKEIIAQAEEDVTSILPESLFLFDPENQLTGRPVYFLGNVPIINKNQALEHMLEKHQRLSKWFPKFTRSLVNWLYFQGDTAYFYSAELLPNGRWAMTATSKPSKIKGHVARLPRYCKQFVLLTSEHQKIDDLILNTWEVTHAKAAIELAATILGPFPIEEYAKTYTNTGWINS